MAENDTVPALTPSEQELMGQVAGFAARRAQNGVYINQMYSKSMGAPVVLIFAIGEQATVLTDMLMKAQVKPPSNGNIEIVTDLNSPGW